MTRLNGTFNGPFYRAIATPTSAGGYIKDNSILKMIEHSLYEGALYQYRDPRDGSGDVEQMLLHLNSYWAIVREMFPEAWELPPKESRLTHGAGIQAMGFVMDHLTEQLPAYNVGTHVVRNALARIKRAAAWTSGSWDFGDGEERKWNSLQNTPSDVRYLTNGLIRVVDQQILF
jgi:hypothetical protein